MIQPPARKKLPGVVQHYIQIFRLESGVASFEERDCTIPLEYMVGLSIHRLLLVGIGAMTRPELVLAGLGDLDRRVEVVTPVEDHEARARLAPMGPTGRSTTAD